MKTDLPDLLDKEATCKMIGGSKAINPATLYRGIKTGIYPRPVKVSPRVCRWRRCELEAALKKRFADRNPAVG